MKNKEIQEKRMRGYFINATKEILKGEGLRGVSVRNIADRAGYSYATLYNYFKDANELVFHCVHDFQEECEAFVKNQTKNIDKDKKRLYDSVIAYINFFLEYPGIFELFYINRVGDFGHLKKTIEIIDNSLINAIQSSVDELVANKILKEENINNLITQLKNMAVGSLVLYLNRQIPPTYQEYTEGLKDQVKVVSKAYFL